MPKATPARVVLLVLTLLPAAARSATVPDAGLFKPGARIKTFLSHDKAVTPGLATFEAYRDFLRSARYRSLEGMKKLGPGLARLANGRTLEVLSYRDDRDFFVRAPAVEAKVLDGELEGMVFWFAAQYLREPGTPLLPGEFPLPALACVRDDGYVAGPGDVLALYREPAGEVVVLKDRFSFEEFIKSAKARDKTGYQELVGDRKLSFAPAGTKIRVLERHENQFFADGVTAIEARVLEGLLKDQVVWVPEFYTAQYILVIAKDRIAPPNATAEPKESKAASLIRMAQGLERSKKAAAALGYYRRLVAEYAESPEAKIAGERIKALERK